jgi:hypothetical protein
MYDKNFSSDLEAKRAASAQAQIAPRINVNSSTQSVVAGVQRAPIQRVNLGSLQPITVQFTASTAAAQTIAIGDPSDLVGSALGITTTAFSGGGNTWSSARLAEWARGGFVISQFNYEASNSSQFAQPLVYGAVDISGNTGKKPLQGLITSASRSTDQNLLIKTVDLSSFNGELVIDRDNALFLTVGAGLTVTLTLTIAAYLQ